jgi:Protein required for attachment to host cells
MKNTLLVVADLGGFKAFKVENHDLHRTPRLELLDEFNNNQAHGRLGDRVSDLAGRFPRGTGLKARGAMSDGERHNIELEARKRLVRQLAERLNHLARDREIEQCYLAASREINHQLVEALEPEVRAKIAKNVPADFTKVERAELLSRF